MDKLNLKDYTFQNVIDFWFSQENKPKWYIKDKEFDKIISEKFLDYYKEAALGNLDHWKLSPEGTLSLIILLDQFPRNMFRGHPKSFSTDSKALSITKEVIAKGLDKNLSTEYKQFLFMPLMHSENLEDQNLSAQLFINDPYSHEYAKRHMEIIKKFGRFPHRNVILGRISKEEEVSFLTTPNSSS